MARSWLPPPRPTRLLLSLVAAAALALTALQPRLPWRVAPRFTVVVDLSESIDRSALSKTLDALAPRLPRRTPWVAFGGEARIFAHFDQLRHLEIDALDLAASDLEGALDVAAATLGLAPPGGERRVLLLSDGLATRGDAAAAARRLARDGIELWALPIPPAAPPASIVTIAADTLQAGRPGTVRATVVAPVAQYATFELVLSAVPPPALGTPSPLAQPSFDPVAQTVTAELTAGLNQLEIAIEPRARGLQLASLLWQETGVRHAVALDVQAPRSVLLVEGGPALTTLAGALRDQGWSVSRSRPRNLGALRSSFRNRDSFEVVLLDDVEALDLDPDAAAALRRWVVELGGGLVFASGPQTYGEDGYSETPLEEILPLQFNVEEERPDVALMIAFDKSYSMRGEAIDLAKEATQAVVDELADEHRFGVVAFDWNPTLVVPLQTLDDRAGVRDAISRIEAGAQTNFLPALESCYQQLRAVEADVEHVILLSDGKTYPDDYESLVTAMFEDGITVSTVAISPEADRKLLADIAGWGHGEAYVVEDASRVQQILLDEARSRIKDTFVEEETRLRLSTPLPPISAALLDAVPPLEGYLVLEGHPRAEVVLASDDAERHPLLARRNVGLGRVWMLAADLDGRWSRAWTSWDGFGNLMTALLSDAAGSGFDDVNLTLAERHGWLVLEAAISGAGGDGVAADGESSGAERNGLEVVLRRDSGLSEARQRTRLPQVAPGLYRTWLTPTRTASPPLADGATREAWVEVEGRTVGMVDLARWQRAERRPEPSDLELLSELTLRTGGRLLPDVEASSVEAGSVETVSVEIGSASTTWGSIAAWPLLATLGLAFYLIELALRRSGLLDRAAARNELP